MAGEVHCREGLCDTCQLLPLIFGETCPISKEVIPSASKRCPALEASIPSWYLPAGRLEDRGQGGKLGLPGIYQPPGSPA